MDYYISNYEIPPVDSYHAIIILGGPMSVNDNIPFMKKELKFVKQIIKRNTPLLGICLGSQLISKSLGGLVTKNAVKEIGIYEINLTTNGSNNILFNNLPTSFKIFEWHGETFSIPSGGELLATSKACLNQAFQFKNAFGIQFHFEFTPLIIKKMLKEYNDEIVNENLKNNEVINDFESNYTKIKEIGKIIIQNFLSLIK